MLNMVMDFLKDKLKIIKEDKDLVYFDAGIAIQKDRNNSIDYDKDYFERYASYEGTNIAIAINKNRIEITERFCKKALLDIGIGAGEFIKSSKKLKIYGFDINPLGIEWLKTRNLFVDPYQEIPKEIQGWTFWDSLEHFSEPQDILTRIGKDQYAFISIPIFHDILKIKEWKHYRPNEHFYYFTFRGMVNYMKFSGFELLDHNDEEIVAGRQDILTFVFRRQS
jgi:hypothetical protein